MWKIVLVGFLVSTVLVIGTVYVLRFQPANSTAIRSDDSERTLFSDNFDNYDVGTFPSGGGWEIVWDGMGTQYQLVTDSVSHSLTKSLQLLGQVEWSANVQRMFSSSAALIGYEAYVRCGGSVASADNVASICMWNLQGQAWGKRFAGVYFASDGYIYTEPIHLGPVNVKLMRYDPDRWYKVRTVIDRTAGEYSVWIDDALMAQNVAIQDTSQIEALMLAAGWAGFRVYFDDVRVFDLTNSKVTLNVTALDESGFVPASADSFTKLAEVKVKVYDENGNMVASGQSGDDGTVAFSLDVGKYVVQYGGCLARSVTTTRSSDLAHYGALLPDSRPVTVHQGTNQLNLYCAWLSFHEYEWGSDGGNPFQLDYLDLNNATSEHETSITVSPGQKVQAVVSFWELETTNVPVWLASAFGDWNPTVALANLDSGVASPSSHNLHTVPFSFTAPTQPGTYHIRINGALDYDWSNSYYTGAHPNPDLNRDMGNSIISCISIDTLTREVTGTYGVAELTVR
jgi:hypothetical protein